MSLWKDDPRRIKFRWNDFSGILHSHSRKCCHYFGLKTSFWIKNNDKTETQIRAYYTLIMISWYHFRTTPGSQILKPSEHHDQPHPEGESNEHTVKERHFPGNILEDTWSGWQREKECRRDREDDRIWIKEEEKLLIMVGKWERVCMYLRILE